MKMLIVSLLSLAAGALFAEETSYILMYSVSDSRKCLDLIKVPYKNFEVCEDTLKAYQAKGLYRDEVIHGQLFYYLCVEKSVALIELRQQSKSCYE